MADPVSSSAPDVVSAELVPRPAAETGVDRLRRRLEKIAEDDTRVVNGMNRFAELPTQLEVEAGGEALDAIALLLKGTDEEIRAAGWKSKKELRLAYYGRQPKSKWPAAMQAAHERVGMRIRKLAANTGPKVFNLNMISIPAPQRPGADERIVIVQPKKRDE